MCIALIRAIATIPVTLQIIRHWFAGEISVGMCSAFAALSALTVLSWCAPALPSSSDIAITANFYVSARHTNAQTCALAWRPAKSDVVVTFNINASTPSYR